MNKLSLRFATTSKSDFQSNAKLILFVIYSSFWDDWIEAMGELIK